MNLRTSDAGAVNVNKRWGACWGSVSTTAITDGCYFELSGSTFSVANMKGGVVSRVPSGSFNGQLGYTHTPSTNNTVYEITMLNGSILYIVGGVLLHKSTFPTATWSNSLNLQCYADVVNTGKQLGVPTPKLDAFKPYIDEMNAIIKK